VSEKQDAIQLVENLMLNTPFPKPIKGSDLAIISRVSGLKFHDDADLSQEELARTWLLLVAPDRVRTDRGYVPREEAEAQMPRVSLYAYIAYLTLLIRLSKSYLSGQVSGSVFTTLAYDWSKYLSRHALVAGIKLSSSYGSLIERADLYPELEKEKGVYGMLDDQKLKRLAQEILSALEQFWVETQLKLRVREISRQ